MFISQSGIEWFYVDFVTMISSNEMMSSLSQDSIGIISGYCIFAHDVWIGQMTNICKGVYMQYWLNYAHCR